MNMKKTWKATWALLLFFCPMLIQAESVWIDVRSSAEYKVDHIEGDILISHVEIVEGVNQLFSNKDTKIHLYCRSGHRAEIAKSALEKIGYTDVVNEGGIDDARKVRALSP